MTSKETQALIPTWKRCCKDFSHSRRSSFKLCLVSNSKGDFSHWKTNSVQKWTVRLVLSRTKCKSSRPNSKIRRKLLRHVSGGSDKLGFDGCLRETFTDHNRIFLDKLEGFSRRDNLEFFNIPQSADEDYETCVTKVVSILQDHHHLTISSTATITSTTTTVLPQPPLPPSQPSHTTTITTITTISHNHHYHHHNHLTQPPLPPSPPSHTTTTTITTITQPPSPQSPPSHTTTTSTIAITTTTFSTTTTTSSSTTTTTTTFTTLQLSSNSCCCHCGHGRTKS